MTPIYFCYAEGWSFYIFSSGGGLN
jgi:hypothetical protein